MRKSIYPVIFMMGITFISILMLAILNEITKNRIDEYREIEEKKQILYIFNLSNENDSNQKIEDKFSKYIKIETKDNISKYTALNNDEIIGYGFKIEGKGLWGLIEGYIALSKDYNKIIGLTFIKHSETPGLGGRIDETWFKDQFRELEIGDNISLIFRPREGGNIDSISGATQTSDKVRLLIVNEIEKIRDKWRD